MFFILLLLFTVLPAAELYILIQVGRKIGALETIGLVIAIGALGAYLARLQGFLVLQKLQNTLNQGMIPSSELMDGAMILAGGILLLAPGFITDVFGILLLLPPVRSFIKWILRKQMERMVKNNQAFTHSRFQKFERYDDIDI